MRLIVMNIPDQAEALAGWLERQLVGLDLAPLVAELKAVHTPALFLTLDDVLGNQRLDVLQSGLKVLPPAALQNLLRNPRLLLDLQDVVLENGGPYWSQVDAGGEMEIVMQRGEQRLLTSLRDQRPAAPPRPVIRPADMAQAWYQRPWVVSLATAAAILLAVSTYLYATRPAVQQPTSTAELEKKLDELQAKLEKAEKDKATGDRTVAWGWSKPEALPQDLPAPKYLNQLADSAEDWFKKKPDDAPALAKRLNELRQGCSTLILASHQPLKDADRAWLKERCQKWAEKFDAKLAELETHPENAEKIRTDVDGIVRNLQKALRERAEQVEAA